MAKSKYNSKTFPKLAEEYAKQGFGDKAIAKKLGIAESTFYEYVKKYPKFSEALKRGKAPSDEKVENAYYNLAVGHYVQEEKRFLGSNGDVKETVITKKWVQSERASFNWLCNRMSDKWSNSQHITSENKTDLDISQADAIMANMTLEERQTMIKKVLKKNQE